MDSLSQAALGAAVGVAVLGGKRPFWQAALSGAVVGTLPDLDVFIDKGDAISNMVLHRAETHAFFWQLLASLPLAWLLAHLTRTRQLLSSWWWMVIAVLITHSLLDSLTVYGTRILLPFSDTPIASGSLFIIDPLYTLPLLLGLLFAGLSRQATHRRWNTRGLIFSSLYALWAVGAQAHVATQVKASPLAAGLDDEQMLIIPTPFNTLLWRIVLVDGDRYHEGFYSVLDPWVDPQRPIRFKEYPRGQALDQATAHLTLANQVRAFSKGFYKVSSDGQHITITDLRMGQEPFYVFGFHVARSERPGEAIEPIRYSRRVPLDSGLAWLRQRMFGADIPPAG